MQFGRKDSKNFRKFAPDSKGWISNDDARKSLLKALRTDASSSSTTAILPYLACRSLGRRNQYQAGQNRPHNFISLEVMSVLVSQNPTGDLLTA